MIGLYASEHELQMLRNEFVRVTGDVQTYLRRLDKALNNLTAENCPLSPCEGCLLTRCVLRKVKHS